MNQALIVIDENQTKQNLQDSARTRILGKCFANVRAYLREANEPLAAMSTFDLCAMVTLVLLFLYAGTHWYLMAPTRALCLLAIFVAPLRNRPHIWFLLFSLMAITNYFDRFIIDNHKYLMTYWVLVMVLTASERDTEKRDHFLSFNGRILLGLAFSFAVVAKLLSGDFLNGDFFRYTLQLDERFVNLIRFAGGADANLLSDIPKLTSDLKSAYLLGVDINQVPLIHSGRLSFLIYSMTWWTLFIETAVALVFIWPWPSRLCDWGRRYLLWIFLFTTYAIAFVPGFAWTLTVLGIAQMPKSQSRYRIVYILLVAVALQIYQLPSVSLLRRYL